MDHILIVEDNELIRESLAKLLEFEGYRIVTAANGEEALNCLAKLPLPKLIFLDLIMPVMDGWKFLGIISEDESYNKLPVVVLSATPHVKKINGIVALLAKPAAIEDILEWASRYCSTTACEGAPSK